MGADYRIKVEVDGAAAVGALNRELEKTGRVGQVSAAQTAAAMRTLPAQFTDIATQLAGGQSPFLILLQQGGQIKDSFGGVGNALTALTSLITPARLAFGGLAAAVGAFAFAAVEGYNESMALQRAIVTTGNFAGVTASQFETAAARIQQSAGVTAGASRDLLMRSVASGQFGPGNVELVATAMANLQRITGQTSDDIAKVFAKLSDGASKWAAETNKAYNFLTVEQFKYIRQLEEQGKKEEAIGVAVGALNDSLKGRAVQLGSLEKGWKAVGNAASAAWNAMLNVGRETTTQQRYDDARVRLDELKAANPAGMREMFPGRARLMDTEIAKQQALVDSLNELVRMENRAASAQAARASANQTAIAQEIEKAKEKGTVQRSEFDRLKEQYENQLMGARQLTLEEQFLQEVQLGRYKTLSQAQIENLRGIARTIDETKAASELEKERAATAARLAREQESAAKREETRLNNLRDKYVELVDPMERVRKQLLEIDELISAEKIDIGTGMAAKIKVVQEAAERMRDNGKDAFEDLTRAVEGWGRKATDTFIDFAFKGKASFGDLVTSILADMARIIIQRNVMGPLMDTLFPKGGGAGGGTNFLSTAVAAARGFFGFAKGDVFDSPTLFKFANGGAMQNGVMGEAGPEAVMPLRRGADGKLGVAATGGGRMVVNVVVNADGGMSSDGDGGKMARLGQLIGATVRQELITQKRPGGLLAAA